MVGACPGRNGRLRSPNSSQSLETGSCSSNWRLRLATFSSFPFPTEEEHPQGSSGRAQGVQRATTVRKTLPSFLRACSISIRAGPD